MSAILMMPLWAWPMLTLGVGAVLLVVGLRGRRIDDSPLCRRCGYDLTGSAHASVCSECGADLTRRRAVARGHRRRKPVALAFGLTLIIPTLVVIVGFAFVMLKGADADQHKPIWWLTRQADAGALAELNRRLAGGQLDAKQTHEVIAAALAAQADRRRPWLPAWGDFVETAWRTALIDEAQWDTYVRQAVDVRLEARPRIRRGDHVIVSAPAVVDRGATFSLLAVSWQPPDARFGDVPLDAANRASEGVFNFFASSNSVARFATGSKIDGLPDGPHPLRVDVDVGVDASRKGDESVRFTVRREASVTIVPPAEPLILMRSDPAARTAAEDATRRVMIGVDVDHGVSVHVFSQQPTLGLSVDVLLRDRAGREWPLGKAAFPARFPRAWSVRTKLDGFDAQRVDVVLRGNRSLKVTEDSLSAELFDGEIVHRDVFVAWAPGVEPSRGATTNASAPTR